MRLWSLHPSYLDSKGLVALWRETLLAQNVLRGNTKGYKNHPQLNRFKSQTDPVIYIGCYLFEIYNEAERRGYNFNFDKISKYSEGLALIWVTDGQMQYEWEHLKKKLEHRSPETLLAIKNAHPLSPHPLFKIVSGAVEPWEVQI